LRTQNCQDPGEIVIVASPAVGQHDRLHPSFQGVGRVSTGCYPKPSATSPLGVRLKRFNERLPPNTIRIGWLLVRVGDTNPSLQAQGFYSRANRQAPEYCDADRRNAMSLLFLIVACKPLTNLVRQMWFLPEYHPNDYSECESNWVRGGITSKTQGPLDNRRAKLLHPPKGPPLY